MLGSFQAIQQRAAKSEYINMESGLFFFYFFFDIFLFFDIFMNNELKSISVTKFSPPQRHEARRTIWNDHGWGSPRRSQRDCCSLRLREVTALRRDHQNSLSICIAECRLHQGYFLIGAIRGDHLIEGLRSRLGLRLPGLGIPQS